MVLPLKLQLILVRGGRRYQVKIPGDQSRHIRLQRGLDMGLQLVKEGTQFSCHRIGDREQRPWRWELAI